MEVEMRPPAALKPYENNPRQNDEAVDAVAESIRRFGFRQPIVVDADGVIVAGHTRYKAALKLGLTEVPVHVARDLTPEQARAYRLADNRLAELSRWDLDLLPIELADLRPADVDLTALGWDAKEIERLIASVGDGPPPAGAAGRELDESAADGVETVTCPKCGHEFPR